MRLLYQSIFSVSKAKWWQVVAASLIGALAALWIWVKEPKNGVSAIPLILLGGAMGLASGVLLVLKDGTSHWWVSRKPHPTLIDRAIMVIMSLSIGVGAMILVLAIVISFLGLTETHRG